MDSKAIDFLKRLSECFGPSGFEKEPLRILRDHVAAFADGTETDRLGSLLFRKKGGAARPVILMPGHVDEVGFIVSGIHSLGFLTFNPIGGWFDQVLLGQRVLVRGRDRTVPGIISSKPPHLLPPEERTKVVTKDKMFIDVGCSNEREAREMGIRIGDPVTPDSAFFTIEKQVFRRPDGGGEEKAAGTSLLAGGKAFDDRVGAFIAAEVMRRLAEGKIDHPNTLVGAATVQEEVGCRGARTTANLIQPDVCITLEVDIAGDVPGIEAHEAPTKMGRGPSILTMDASMIPNQPLKDFVIRTAEDLKIPYQLSQMVRGGTDAGAVHVSGTGCPSLVVAIPTRHIHSHVGLLSTEDVDHCVRLLTEVVRRLDAGSVERFTAL